VFATPQLEQAFRTLKPGLPDANLSKMEVEKRRAHTVPNVFVSPKRGQRRSRFRGRAYPSNSDQVVPRDGRRTKLALREGET